MPDRIVFRPLPGDGPSMSVDVGVPEATDAVRALFPDHQDAGTGGGCEDADLALRATAAGYELRTADGVWSDPALPGLLARLEITLAAELVRRSGLRGVHAAGVVIQGTAALFTGPGGSGKSSLTAAFAVREVPVLGDDVVLVGRGRAHPFRRLIKVEEPARTLLGLPAPPESLAGLWPDAAFYHPRDLGSRWAEPAPVHRVVLPERTEGAGVEFEERPPAEVLAVLLRGLVPVDRVDAHDFEEAAAMLAGAACYRLRYGETAAAVDALLEAWG